MLQVAVDGAVGNPGQARNKLVPQSRDLHPVLLHMGAGLLQCRRHTGNAGDILRSGPLAPLLGAALDDVHQRDTAPDVQRTHALGAVELMAGQAQHIDVLGLDIDGQVARRLHGVGMEQHALLPAHGADLLNGQDTADLVVGVHHRHQTGVLPDGVRHLLSGDHAVFMNRQQLHLKTLLLQLFQGVENGVMLESRGNNVHLPLAAADGGGGQQCLVVGLAAAGGEDDLPGLAVQAPGHGLPALHQQLCRPLTHAVQTGGIAEVLLHGRQHGIQRRLAHLCGGRVICVNSHRIFLPVSGVITY